MGGEALSGGHLAPPPGYVKSQFLSFKYSRGGGECGVFGLGVTGVSTEAVYDNHSGELRMFIAADTDMPPARRLRRPRGASR